MLNGGRGGKASQWVGNEEEGIRGTERITARAGIPWGKNLMGNSLGTDSGKERSTGGKSSKFDYLHACRGNHFRESFIPIRFLNKELPSFTFT